MAILIILVLIVLNGYFSLAEIALVSVNSNELSEQEEQHNSKAQQVIKLIEDPEEFLSAVQVGITLLGLLEGIYGGDMVAKQLEALLVKAGLSHVLAHITALITGIGLITYLTIVFGELVPKSIALQMPLKVSLAIAPSLSLLSRILFPFIKLLTLSTRFILNLFSVKKGDDRKISERDIKQMLGTAYKQGVVGKQQLWMHENVLTFNNLTARRIMKLAKIVVSVDYNWKKEEITALMRKTPYSYFPVYDGDPANVAGVLNTKNFFLSTESDWHHLIQAPCIIAAETAAKDIFTRFKEKKADFAIVADDKNNYLGIVSMQDIMEGVFGDIPEIDDYSSYLYAKNEKEWIAEGFVHLQRVRVKLALPWIRDYEDKYLNLSEMMKGEISGAAKTDSLQVNGVTFTVLEKTKGEAIRISIALP